MIHTLVLDSRGAKYLNNYGSYYRYNNIPFKMLIGDSEYDKYDFFNVELIEARWDTLTGNTLSQDDCGINITLSGYNNLNQLVNSEYKNEMLLCSYVFPALNFDTQQVVRFSNNTSFTMIKKPNLEVEIKYTDFSNGIIKTGTIYPNLSLLFKITGIPKDENKKK
jgi:hypothetical protein